MERPAPLRPELDSLLQFQYAYWNWTYDDFCERLELPDDDYASLKWVAFKEAGMALIKLGDFAEKIASINAQLERPRAGPDT